MAIYTGADLESTDKAYERIDDALTNVEIPSDVRNPSTTYDPTALFNKAQASINAVSDSNASALRGEIPDDVWQQMEQRTAESGAMQGFGVGGMTGKKTARDLGLTSLQIQQQGQQTQMAVSQSYDTLGKSMEVMREFDSSFAQQAQQLTQSQQQLNLGGVAAGLEYSQYRATLTNDINTKIMDLTKFRETLISSYTADDKADSASLTGSITQIDELLGQIESVLAGV